MKKNIFAIAILSMLAISTFAADIASDFSTAAGDKNWTRNSWTGYNPFPEFGFDEAEKALHIKEATARYGFGMANYKKQLPCTAGDKLDVVFTAKGKGKFSVYVQTVSNKKWVSIDKSNVVTLTPEWKEYKILIPVNDLKNIPTTSVIMSFGGSKGTEVYLKNFNVTKIAK